jgi:hypothetical protein
MARALLFRARFAGADRQLLPDSLKQGFNCRDPAHMVSAW